MEQVDLSEAITAFCRILYNREPADQELQSAISKAKNGAAFSKLLSEVFQGVEAHSSIEGFHSENGQEFNDQPVNPEWYLQRYPDVRDSGSDPTDHFVNYGRREGRFPNALAEEQSSLARQVDRDWYLQRYRDVADAEQDPTDHFIYYGRHEGRFPNAIAEELFNLAQQVDRDWYIQRYQDVAESDKDPTDHFLNYGRHEGRFPNALVEEQESLKTIYSTNDVDDFEPGVLLARLYEVVYGRGILPTELESNMRPINLGAVKLETLIIHHFLDAVRAASAVKDNLQSANDPNKTFIFGRQQFLTVDDWHKQRDLLSIGGAEKPDVSFSRFPYIHHGSVLVSVITSLYKGGNFVRHFLDNICSQSIFRDCELLIIDANSPENEMEVAKEFMKDHANIKYMRCNERVGIYEAWNRAIKMSRGQYCTNANLDDCRAINSLELQASTLNNLGFVDVVYQDVLYSFEPNLDFETIRDFGFSSDLPIVSHYNLTEFNSPHNAPMWRKSIHDDVGYFNPTYKSAGDFDFWMRCKIMGKNFFKLNEPHVAYYVNPAGLSTRADTVGALESYAITRELNKSLISRNLFIPEVRFVDKVQALSGPIARTGGLYEIAQSALGKLSLDSRKSAVGL